MFDKIRRLGSELSTLRDWNEVMADYRLESVAHGVLAYTSTSRVKATRERRTWLCQCCTDAGRKVVLQCVGRAVTSTFKCPQCEFTLTAGKEASKMLRAEPHPVYVVQPTGRRKRHPLV